MRYIKKYIGVLYNLLVCVTGGSLLMMIIWLLLQIFVFASFAIPSDSMEPVLIPGDYVLVNKMLKGPRIFSLGDARQHKPLHIDRFIIRKSKFPQNPKRSVRFSGKRTKRSVQKRKARNTQKAETKVL